MKKIKLTNSDYEKIKSFAMSNFIHCDKGNIISEYFTAYCWLKACITLLNNYGIDIQLVEDKDIDKEPLDNY